MGWPAVCCRSEKLNAFKGAERENKDLYKVIYNFYFFYKFSYLIILHLHLFDMDYVYEWAEEYL